MKQFGIIAFIFFASMLEGILLWRKFDGSMLVEQIPLFMRLATAAMGVMLPLVIIDAILDWFDELHRKESKSA
jgi:hypothetical protein